MKKATFLVLISTLLIVGCQSEELDHFEMTNDIAFKVFEYDPKHPNPNDSREGECFQTNLIAGQHHIAGTVSITISEEDVIVTYATNDDWSIDETHLSLGDCEEQWVPTTGSGNPKVGKFEHKEPHSSNTNEVIYLISKEAIVGLDMFCFAAHAVVNGPTGGETAWGEGIDFDGNNWAMYSQVNVAECGEVSGPPPPPPSDDE